MSPAHPQGSNYNWHSFDSQQELADALASTIISQLQAAIAERGLAVIAFSGGSTPLSLFDALASQTWDWSKVIITLVDERWVEKSNTLSNAALLETNLLDKLSGNPRFVALYRNEFSAACTAAAIELVVADYCNATNTTPRAMAKFDVAILGMGDDGHTASFFPDAQNIANLLDSKNRLPLLSCHSPSSSVARVTWSLPILLGSAYLALHIVGLNKKNVYNHALQTEDYLQMPIRSMLFQQTIQLQVFYCD